MLKLRRVAIQHVQYCTARGTSFLLWHDPWVNRMPPTEQFDQRMVNIMESDLVATISSVLQNRSWNFASTNHISATDLRQLLSSIS